MGSRRTQTNIEIAQSAELITGSGQITGVAIANLTGDVFFSGPAANPPNWDSVAAYLEEVQKIDVTQAGKDASPELARLYKVPFRGHPPGQEATAGDDLVDAVNAVFARDRILERGERLVLLADTGMGKSPALKYVRMHQARTSHGAHREDPEQRAPGNERCRPGEKTVIVPLLIDLAQLEAGLSLYTLICNSFNRYIRPDPTQGISEIGLAQVPDFLNSYCCLILMDNLDALISSRRGSGMQLVRMFMEVHNEHRYVLACRTASYREQLGGLSLLYLDDLEDSDVINLLEEPVHARLSDSMRKLMRNRGMLTQLLSLRQGHESGSEGDPLLLENKGQLLRLRMVRRLQEAYEKDEYPPLSLLEGVLEHLAYLMQLEHVQLLPEQQVMSALRAYLETWHEAVHWRDLLKALEKVSMGFLERDDQRRAWRFCERTDQAYFAATAILAQPERIAPILPEVEDYWWREMFEILVGLLQDPTALFFELIDTAPLLAANCVQYAGRAVHGRVTDAVLDAMVENMQLESSFRRKYIVERIGESRHPRAAEALFLAFHQEWSSTVLKAIARALAEWARHQEVPEDALAEAEKYALQQRRNKSTPVARVVTQYVCAVNGERKAVTVLRRWLRDAKQPARVRGLAALYLAQLAARTPEDEALWAPLLPLFQPDNEGGPPDLDNLVAWCVTEALTDCTLPAVEAAAITLFRNERYCGDEWCDYRARAVYLLGWVSRQNAPRDLLDAALRDDDPLVRGFAVDALARLELPGTRELLQRLLVDDARPETDPDVLRRIAEALAQIGTVDSIPMLDRHVHHERTRTRWMMKRAIAEIRQRYGLPVRQR